MKNSQLEKEKIQQIVKKIYVDELIGKVTVKDNPTLTVEIEKLLNISTEYELKVLTKESVGTLKEILIQQILNVHHLCTTQPNYRTSLIYFDENGNFVDVL